MRAREEVVAVTSRRGERRDRLQRFLVRLETGSDLDLGERGQVTGG